jgi:NADH-quinone oxidoreductase subunit E
LFVLVRARGFPSATGPAGEPTLAGNRLAERHGISVPGFDPETPIAKKGEAQ